LFLGNGPRAQRCKAIWIDEEEEEEEEEGMIIYIVRLKLNHTVKNDPVYCQAETKCHRYE
jgi:hypothetical protein